ncbi:MAG: hypothetical protein IJY01_02255 [Clostridia bacterium]|nr:hypothetical protein [Clostridia bacterium]
MAFIKKSNYTYEGPVNSAGEPEGEGDMRFTSGDRYTGRFKDGVRNGFGIYYFASGDVYSYAGDYLNGRKEGYGTLVYRNGDRFEGYFKEGKKHGWGTYFYKRERGATCEASFRGQYHNGLKHGKFTKRDQYGYETFYYEHEWDGDAPEREPEKPKQVLINAVKTDSEVRLQIEKTMKERNPVTRRQAGLDKGDYYSGETYQGLPHGRGKYRYSSGGFYSGEFRFGKLTGKGWLDYGNGSHYEGGFLDGLEHGEGKIIDNDWQGQGFKWRSTSVVMGTWQNGILERGTVKYKKRGDDYIGDVYVGEFATGTYIPHGEGVYTEKDGSRYEGEFKHGLRHGYGTYIKVYDGSTYRGFWEGGVRHGYGELTYRQESDYYGKKNKKGQWKNDVFIKPM